MKKGLPVAICGLLFLAAALLLQPEVPLYDGVGMPDEPYRYVEPPKGRETDKQPTGAKESGIGEAGLNKDGIYIATLEQGPQLYASFTQQAFNLPQSATLVNVTVQPQAPDGSKADIGPIVGNVYRIGANSDTGPAAYNPAATAPSYVDMRLPQGYPAGSTMVYRAVGSTGWQDVQTSQVGEDIYEAKFVGLGEYALTSKAMYSKPAPAAVAGATKSRWPLMAAAAGGGVLLLGAGITIFIKRKSKHRAAATTSNKY